MGAGCWSVGVSVCVVLQYAKCCSMPGDEVCACLLRGGALALNLELSLLMLTVTIDVAAVPGIG